MHTILIHHAPYSYALARYSPIYAIYASPRKTRITSSRHSPDNSTAEPGMKEACENYMLRVHDMHNAANAQIEGVGTALVAHHSKVLYSCCASTASRYCTHYCAVLTT
jgi:hypothetical protein